jgi:hypothetical protein
MDKGEMKRRLGREKEEDEWELRYNRQEIAKKR